MIDPSIQILENFRTPYCAKFPPPPTLTYDNIFSTFLVAVAGENEELCSKIQRGRPCKVNSRNMQTQPQTVDTKLTLIPFNFFYYRKEKNHILP